MAARGTLFVIAAPSGGGKTTLVNALIEQSGKDYIVERMVTYTSRSPRKDEKHGNDYHFIDEAQFKHKIESGFFIEWSDVYGAYYGSPLSELSKLEQGISLFMILDVKGALEVIRMCNPIAIWIVPPTLQALEERLQKRATEPQVDQDFRLKLGRAELADHESIRHFNHIIINDDQEQALSQLKEIVFGYSKETSINSDHDNKHHVQAIPKPDTFPLLEDVPPF